MIRLFALLPLITFGLWWLYLNHNGWSLKQGKSGFIKIFIFNVVVLGFFAIMHLVTQVE
ncbi:hypothetical protein [Catenovulum maritimum]|uniref:Membrane protein n=1 Tax=Catenovulum maritimum TaxID=1513271 RepID=A0A0J8GSZ2_9ALTE|nr:hypothetical protein [Catenovulum maritimum]KMT65877.1 membrane protein [Catenovulum maritimum]